jgi:hypothetical protein
MKRSAAFFPNSSNKNSTLNPIPGEMAGYIGLGMRKEALKLARQYLKKPRLTESEFEDAMGFVLTEDRMESWVPLVESAYGRLTIKTRRRCRFSMLSFYVCNEMPNRAFQFLPPTFRGQYGLIELAFAMHLRLDLDQLSEAGKLVTPCLRGIETADEPVTKAMLTNCIATFYARRGAVDEAIFLWQKLRNDPSYGESAAIGIAESYLALAIKSIKTGLESFDRLMKDPDPEIEIILPGNEKARWQFAERQLDRLGKKLIEIMTPDQLKNYGIEGN